MLRHALHSTLESPNRKETVAHSSKFLTRVPCRGVLPLPSSLPHSVCVLPGSTSPGNYLPSRLVLRTSFQIGPNVRQCNEQMLEPRSNFIWLNIFYTKQERELFVWSLVSTPGCCGGHSTGQIRAGGHRPHQGSLSSPGPWLDPSKATASERLLGPWASGKMGIMTDRYHFWESMKSLEGRFLETGHMTHVSTASAVGKKCHSAHTCFLVVTAQLQCHRQWHLHLPTLVRGQKPSDLWLESPCKDEVPLQVNRSKSFQEGRITQTIEEWLPFTVAFIVDTSSKLILLVKSSWGNHHCDCLHKQWAHQGQEPSYQRRGHCLAQLGPDLKLNKYTGNLVKVLL